MNILVISNLYPPLYVGGYELHCRTVVEALRQRGHSVAVLTSDHGCNGAENPTVDNEIFRSLKIHGLFGHPFLGIFQLRALELHNNQTLVSTVRRIRPDIVYIWNFSGLSKSMLLTLQRLAIPTVYAVCDYWVARSEYADVWLSWWNRKDATIKQRVLRKLWTLSGQRQSRQNLTPTNPIKHIRFDRIHFCSSALRKATIKEGFDVQHGRIIYCPLDVKRFTGEPHNIHRPLQRLLYVGRLHQDKGIMTALRAMTLIRDKFAGQLSIYGRGDAEFEKHLIAYVSEHQLPVTFNALLNVEQMPAVYQAHDALLFTSEWEEPFALTPLEAMACGIPVIGTTTGGSAELFVHNVNSLTFGAGKPEELAQRILELDTDAMLRHRIARAAQVEVRTRFAEPIIVGQIEEYLNETLQNWKPAELPNYTA